MPLDRIDRKILDHLQRHGRASNLELSQLTSLSPAQSHRRHRRLEEQGYISGYAARVPAPLVGLGVVAFVHVTMERGHVNEIRRFTEHLSDEPRVLECYAVTGDFDYVLKVVAPDLPSLSRFVMGGLMHMPGVSAVRSSVCLDEVKFTTALPLE